MTRRYCQQCSRLQPFDDFDAGRRSCRTSLAAHSQRRRLRGLGTAAAGKHGKGSRGGSAGGSNSGSSQQPSSSNSAHAVGGSSTPGTSGQLAGDQQQQLQQQEGQQQQQQHVRTPSPGAATMDKDSLLLPLDMLPIDQMLALPQQSVLPPPSRQPTKQQQQQRAQAVVGIDHRKHYQQQQQQRAQASVALPAAQHRRLQPGSVSEALLAAIGENIGQGLSPSPSMQGQQHPLAPAGATSDGRGSYGAASGRGAASVFGSASMDLPEGGLLYNTGTLVGSKRDREAMTQADIAAQFLGALEQRQQLQQQQRQQELLRLQRQRQQEQQQQALYRQAPGLVQAPGCDSLASALLSNLGLNLPPQAPVYDDTTDLDWPKLRNSGSNSGAHTSSSSRSRNPAVQQLMSVLRNMPAAGMPLLQMAMQRGSQQGAARGQRSMQHPQVLQTDVQVQLLQASMLAPSSRSPSSLAGTGAELSPSAQLTVSEAQTMSQHMRGSPTQLDGDSDSSSDGDTGPSTLRQRLTSLLKNLPPGGLPTLRAALQEAEQVPLCAADGGKRAVSSAGLRFPAGAHAQLQFAQQQQLTALTADQDVGPFFGEPVPTTPAAAHAYNVCRTDRCRCWC